MNKKKLHVKMKLFLDNKKVSVRTLSKETNIHRNWLQDFINNKAKVIPIEHLEILCSYLDCDSSDIFEMINDLEQVA